MPKAIYPVVPYQLIQGIRLAHALMESNFEVCIPEEYEVRFSELRSRFGARFRVGVRDCAYLTDCQVIHPEPWTSVGRIERPLIFPHAIVDHCRRLWDPQRPYEFTFAGLVTEKRASVLRQWADRSGAVDPRAFRPSTPRSAVVDRIRDIIRPGGKDRPVRRGRLVIWSSDRGRVFPIKSWDQHYYELLARSRFVLCPNGDFPWTYRFFEAVLCGAIPIVEEDVPAYEGFSYRRMDEPMSEWDWDPATAERNFALCAARLTVPLSELDQELERLLEVGAVPV